MTTLTAILATDVAGAIGHKGGLPWPRMRRDLQRFKAITLGKVCLVGRKTYESLPSLPGRTLAVLTRPVRDFPRGDVYVSAGSVESALSWAREEGHPEVYVIGGADVYRQLLPRCDRLLLTVVHGEYPADVRLDDPTEGFVQLDSETHDPDPTNPARLTFSTWARKA